MAKSQPLWHYCPVVNANIVKQADNGPETVCLLRAPGLMGPGQMLTDSRLKDEAGDRAVFAFSVVSSWPDW